MNKTVQYVKEIYFLQDHMFISGMHVLDGHVSVPSGRNEKMHENDISILCKWSKKSSQ